MGDLFAAPRRQWGLLVLRGIGTSAQCGQMLFAFAGYLVVNYLGMLIYVAGVLVFLLSLPKSGGKKEASLQ